MSRTSRRCIDQERKKSDLINLLGVNKPRAGLKRRFTSVLQEEASNSPERVVGEASFPKPGTYLDAQEKREKIRVFTSGKRCFLLEANVCRQRCGSHIQKHLTWLSLCRGFQNTSSAPGHQPQVFSLWDAAGHFRLWSRHKLHRAEQAACHTGPSWVPLD